LLSLIPNVHHRKSRILSALGYFDHTGADCDLAGGRRGVVVECIFVAQLHSISSTVAARLRQALPLFDIVRVHALRIAV
jgi:hypothetical protein